MSRIVAVHGIAQQRKGPDTIATEWLPAMKDGMAIAGYGVIEASDLKVAFYGDLFRPVGRSLDPYYKAADVSEIEEQQLLELWWREAAATDPQVVSPDARTRLRTPNLVQTALYALSNSRFFTGVVERALIFDLKQVRDYFRNPVTRQQVQARVVGTVTSETRVLVGHSLGSVVAWEAACAHPEWNLEGFVTLGAPLGIRNLIFDKLVPAPIEGRGAWPGKARYWVNISDRGDVVALERNLRKRFDPRVEDRVVDNGATAHDARPYLTSREAGEAISRGL
jgi:hypothetical protein